MKGKRRLGASRLVSILAAATLWPSCVPHLEIEGAPCPCPEGYICCGSRYHACVARDADCPANYPPSSADPCTLDSLCGPYELCQAWTVEGNLSGPRECRSTCPDDFPCAEGEVCQLAPHNARPLEQLNLALLCVPLTPPG